MYANRHEFRPIMYTVRDETKCTCNRLDWITSSKPSTRIELKFVTYQLRCLSVSLLREAYH